MSKLSAAIHNNVTKKRSGNLAKLVIAASMAVASSQAMAAVVCFNTPITVPVTTAGVYINLFTGVSAALPAGATGWDFNPWGSGGAFFYTGTAPPAGGFVSSGGLIANLPTGTLVDATSTYLGNGSATTMATWRAGITNGYLGMRFVESANTYYAWVSVTTTGPTTGLPITVNNWCFQNTPDTGITVGTTPVSLQNFSVD